MCIRDRFDADSKVLVSADGGLPWKGSPEPFFNENGEEDVYKRQTLVGTRAPALKPHAKV